MGGELHIVKNTLFSIVLDQLGYDHGKLLENSTLVGFAFSDAPALAKIVNDTAKSDIFKVKGGVLDKKAINPAQVKAPADLPPLPAVRPQLLGALPAPAPPPLRPPWSPDAQTGRGR